MMTLEKAIESLPTRGYLDLEIPKGIDLVEEINKVRKEKNAII